MAEEHYIDRAVRLFITSNMVQYFFSNVEGKIEYEKLKYSFKNYLRVLGLREADFERFIESLIFRGIDVSHLVSLLGMDMNNFESITNRNSINIYYGLSNGDLVVCRGYDGPDDVYVKKYFVTGIEVTTGNHFFVSVNGISGHSDVLQKAEEFFQDDLEVVEGGFMDIHLNHRSIRLHGSSNTFHVHAGLISKLLLERALPDWGIESCG